MTKTETGEYVYLEWEPRAVACSRGNVRTGMTYDAEVRFLDKQYVISTGHPTREAAMDSANIIVNDMINKIKAVGQEALSKFREAKP